MATSEAEILEQYRIALHNARHQVAVAEILNEFGYGPDTLAEGDARLATARSASTVAERRKAKHRRLTISSPRRRTSLSTCMRWTEKRRGWFLARIRSSQNSLGLSATCPAPLSGYWRRRRPFIPSAWPIRRSRADWRG